MPLRGINAGKLDRRITIQQRSDANIDGQTRTTWPELYVGIAAGFTPQTASEVFRTGQRQATEDGIFRVRWRSDWVPSPQDHRIVYNGKTWDITGVFEVNRREGWDLMAKVRATPGGG